MPHAPTGRPRVLSVTTDLELSGAKRVLVDGAVGLDRTRFEPHVLLLSPTAPEDPLRRELDEAGVPVHHVRVRSRLHWRGLRELRAWFHREGVPDVLHTHSQRSAGALLLTVARLPREERPRCVVHFHGTVSPRALRLKHRILDRWLRRYIDLVLTPTVDAALVAGHAHGFRGLPTRVIPNGIPVDRLARPLRTVAGTRKAWGVPPDAAVVLLLGRWDETKGQDVLLDAIPEVLAHPEDVRFVFVAPESSGRYRRQLERLVERTALRRCVHLMGRDVDPASSYAAADVVVVPSRKESFGLVALESMAAGCRLVASRLPALVEVCGDDAGAVWVRPGDAHDLARGLRLALSETAEERHARCVLHRRHAARFDVRRYIGHLESAYADVLGRPDLLPPAGRSVGSVDLVWSARGAEARPCGPLRGTRPATAPRTTA